jgi:Holliday junction resolvase RusA-like endonuclease
MNDAERPDLFDTGRDPFSPVMLARGNGTGNCDVVAEIVPTAKAGEPLLRIVVVGTPRPQGSKKAFYNAKLGRALVVDDNDVKLRTWRQDVVSATVAAIRAARFEKAAPQTALGVTITFMMPRPKGHWRTGRNAHLLRDDVSAYPSTKPDGDKLLRATMDAMRDAGVYVDDAQVVDYEVHKRWASERPGALIEVSAA